MRGPRYNMRGQQARGLTTHTLGSGNYCHFLSVLLSLAMCEKGLMHSVIDVPLVLLATSLDNKLGINLPWPY